MSVFTNKIVVRFPGPPGAATGGGAQGYTHQQAIASASWTIPHSLGRKPAGIRVEDSSGTEILGFEVTDTDANNAILVFAAAFAGVAYLI